MSKMGDYVLMLDENTEYDASKEAYGPEDKTVTYDKFSQINLAVERAIALLDALGTTSQGQVYIKTRVLERLAEIRDVAKAEMDLEDMASDERIKQAEERRRAEIEQYESHTGKRWAQEDDIPF